jgi:hypothetical protein
MNFTFKGRMYAALNIDTFTCILFPVIVIKEPESHTLLLHVSGQNSPIQPLSITTYYIYGAMSAHNYGKVLCYLGSKNWRKLLI